VAHRLAPKIHVCYHGLDLPVFPFRPDDRPPGKLIAVGRLARDKGFAYLLRAVAVLAGRGSPVQLEIVGDGEERRPLERLPRRLGIGDRVAFRGWLTLDEVRSAMGQATVLLRPSDGLGAGLPNVLRAAIPLGPPVRASGMTVPLQPLTQEERHARFILELLLDDPAGKGPALDGPDWPLLARLAQRHAVLVRVADRLVDLGVPVPPGFAAAAEWERD